MKLAMPQFLASSNGITAVCAQSLVQRGRPLSKSKQVDLQSATVAYQSIG